MTIAWMSSRLRPGSPPRVGFGPPDPFVSTSVRLDDDSFAPWRSPPSPSTVVVDPGSDDAPPVAPGPLLGPAPPPVALAAAGPEASGGLAGAALPHATAKTMPDSERPRNAVRAPMRAKRVRMRGR